MLIKQFCDATGLPRDTVRFYVKRGLLRPKIGCQPGNRYQVFDAAQVERAKLIKSAQRLGFSLKQIAEFGTRYDAEGVGSEAKAAILRAQINGIVEQEKELRHMRTYLTAKLSWVENGEKGGPPTFPRTAGSGTANHLSAVAPQRRNRKAETVGRKAPHD